MQTQRVAGWTRWESINRHIQSWAHLWGKLRQLPHAGDWPGAPTSIDHPTPLMILLFPGLEKEEGAKQKWEGQESVFGKQRLAHHKGGAAFGMPPQMPDGPGLALNTSYHWRKIVGMTLAQPLKYPSKWPRCLLALCCKYAFEDSNLQDQHQIAVCGCYSWTIRDKGMSH